MSDTNEQLQRSKLLPDVSPEELLGIIGEQILLKLDDIQIPEITMPDIQLPEIVLPKFPDIKFPKMTFPKEIKVSTLPEFPKTIAVSNFPDYPTIDLTKDFKGLDTRLDTSFTDLSDVLRWDNRKEAPVRVQIMDKKGAVIDKFAPDVSVKGGGGSSGELTRATNFEGAPVVVGTTAVELTFSGTTKSISIQSDPDNTGNIWIGKSTVTNTGANAMRQLTSGASYEMDYDDQANAIYVISDTAGSNVFKLALTS